MKISKTLVSVMAAVAMTVVSVPVVPVYAAPAAIATFDFENGTAGLSDTGFGTAPTVVQDAERGNVLQFHAGTSSEYQTHVTNPDTITKEYNTELVTGSPSSLKLDTNPFAGKSLTGATITMWVKAPAEAGENGSGLVGFVSAKQSNITHPDNKPDSPTDISGYDVYGISTGANTGIVENAMFELRALLSNSLWYFDYDQTFINNANKWMHMAVTIGNNVQDNKVYINGQPLADGEVDGGKRFNHGETVGGTPGNTTQPLLMEILTWPDTQAYIGYTGYLGTVEGVCLDDLNYYDSILSAADIASIYEAQKNGTPSGGSGTSADGSGNASAGQNSSAGANNASGTASGNSASGSAGGSASSGSNKSASGAGNTNNQNLPQTGVVSTGLLVAGGAAAVAAGAMLFKKKEHED